MSPSTVFFKGGPRGQIEDYVRTKRYLERAASQSEYPTGLQGKPSKVSNSQILRPLFQAWEVNAINAALPPLADPHSTRSLRHGYLRRSDPPVKTSEARATAHSVGLHLANEQGKVEGPRLSPIDKSWLG